MSDDGKCYAATPAATLEEHILNSNIAKSDTEWWAHDEITRLRADLAAVTEERDRMREALKRIDGMATTICMRADSGYGMTVEAVMPIYETARAAIEGVTEKSALKVDYDVIQSLLELKSLKVDFYTKYVAGKAIEEISRLRAAVDGATTLESPR